MQEDLDRARAGKAKPGLPNETQALAAQEEFQELLNTRLSGLDPEQGRLKNFYHTMSSVAIVEHTDAQVEGDYPPCGGDNPSLDEIYKEISDALGAISSGTADIPGWGTVVSIVAGILSVATAALGQRHQSHSSCRNAIALVPSCIDSIDKLSFDAWIGEGQNPLANPKVDVLNDNWWGWKHVDKPILSKNPVGKIAVRTPGHGEPRTALCEVRALTINVRNWSHNRNLLFQSKVSWDAPMPGGCAQCPDYGMVSEAYRDTWLFSPMTENVEGRMKRYLSDAMNQAGNYEKAYKKDHP